MFAIHCTGSEAPWWHAFPIYQGHKNRKVYLRWGCPLEEPQRVYVSPLVEARRYSNILQHDPHVKTQIALAKEMGVSRVRITQVMNLLKLAPEIQEWLLTLQNQKAIRFFSERRLRPLIQIEDPKQQVREFRRMLSQVQG
jgi:hypothetical protein